MFLPLPYGKKAKEMSTRAVIDTTGFTVSDHAHPLLIETPCPRVMRTGNEDATASIALGSTLLSLP